MDSTLRFSTCRLTETKEAKEAVKSRRRRRKSTSASDFPSWKTFWTAKITSLTKKSMDFSLTTKTIFDANNPTRPSVRTIWEVVGKTRPSVGNRTGYFEVPFILRWRRCGKCLSTFPKIRKPTNHFLLDRFSSKPEERFASGVSKAGNRRTAFRFKAEPPAAPTLANTPPP